MSYQKHVTTKTQYRKLSDARICYVRTPQYFVAEHSVQNLVDAGMTVEQAEESILGMMEAADKSPFKF